MPATISHAVHHLNHPKSTPLEREQLASSWLTRRISSQELVNPPYKRLQLGAWPRAERIIFGLGRGVEMGIPFEARL